MQVLQVKFKCGPETACPVNTGCERHGRCDTDTSQTSVYVSRKREERRREDARRTERIECEEQPAVRHPERVPHARRQVDLLVEVVEESLLGRERAHGDDALEQLAEVGEYGAASVRLHTPDVATGV